MRETIQLWPAGKSVTFSGQYPHYVVHEGDDQREANQAENREIHANVLANCYVERDVLCCDSSLLTALFEKQFEGFDWEDVENIYADTAKWELPQCMDYADEHDLDVDGVPNPGRMGREECVELLESIGIECRDDEGVDVLREAVRANIADGSLDGLDAWRELCRDHAQDNPAEVFEWWRVTGWLCEKLRESGEVVLDNDYGYWWGRTCTGQGMIMDGTLQAIAFNAIDATY